MINISIIKSISITSSVSSISITSPGNSNQFLRGKQIAADVFLFNSKHISPCLLFWLLALFLLATFPQPAGRVYSRIAVLGRGHDVWAQVARGEGGGCGGGESEVSITLCSRVSLLLFVVRLGPSLSVVELVHTVYLRACVLDLSLIHI